MSDRHESTCINIAPNNFPLLPITSPKTIEQCRNLPLKSSDIFICSYPKSGTTWTQHILLSLLRAEEGKDIPEYDHVSDYAPFYEIDPHWESDDADSPRILQSICDKHSLLGRRVFNTHLRWDMLPCNAEASADNTGMEAESCGAKFIYLVRSPLDVCVSFYHHLSSQVEGRYEKGFDNFFSDWLAGRIAFGSWIDHIQSFAAAAPFVNSFQKNENVKDTRKVLLIYYEDLISDLSTQVDRIIEFLGLHVPESVRTELLPTFSFKHMKNEKNLSKFQPKSVTWIGDYKFLRNGVVGDYSSLITREQEEAFIASFSQNEDFINCINHTFGPVGSSKLNLF